MKRKTILKATGITFIISLIILVVLPILFANTITEKVKVLANKNLEGKLNFNESNELDLRSIFNHKYPALLKINYKIALDTEFTETINRNSIANKISLLPPFAGG